MTTEATPEAAPAAPTEAAPAPAPAASIDEQMAAAARSLVADDGLVHDDATAGAALAAEAPTEAPAEVAPAGTEAAPVEPEVPEPPPAAPTIDILEHHKQIAERDARIAALEGAPKPEPEAISLALQSRDPGKVVAALQAAGMSFHDIAQHVIDAGEGGQAAPKAVDPRDARIDALEAQWKAAEDAKAEAAQAKSASEAQAAQDGAINDHIKAKADQFPLLAHAGRADLVLQQIRSEYSGAIPQFRSDAEAALVVEQAAKRVEDSLSKELDGYAAQPAIRDYLAKTLGLTAPPAVAPPRTDIRDSEGAPAPVSISNSTTQQRSSLRVDEHPSDDELERRAAAAMQVVMNQSN